MLVLMENVINEYSLGDSAQFVQSKTNFEKKKLCETISRQIFATDRFAQLIYNNKEKRRIPGH